MTCLLCFGGRRLGRSVQDQRPPKPQDSNHGRFLPCNSSKGHLRQYLQHERLQQQDPSHPIGDQRRYQY